MTRPQLLIIRLMESHWSGTVRARGGPCVCNWISVREGEGWGIKAVGLQMQVFFPSPKSMWAGLSRIQNMSGSTHYFHSYLHVRLWALQWGKNSNNTFITFWIQVTTFAAQCLQSCYSKLSKLLYVHVRASSVQRILEQFLLNSIWNTLWIEVPGLKNGR